MGAIGTAWELHLAAELSRLDGPGDPTAWEAAAEAWTAAGWSRERALALLGLARALAGAGSPEQARNTLRKVGEIAHRLGATPMQAAAEEIARHAGIGATMHDQVQGGVAALTNRELEVLELITRGYSNNRIATELFISPKTASVHVSNILAKLHASSRTEAMAVARRTQTRETS